MCFYSDELKNVEFPPKPKPNEKGYTCIFTQIVPVRRGKALAFNKENLGCFGSFLPFGFDTVVTEEVKYYTCNIERSIKSYKHLDNMYAHHPPRKAPGKYLIFKRWDKLEEGDNSQLVFFFGDADVMTGLHGLANFDSNTPFGVIAPFGTGCDSIVGYPMQELDSEHPRAVLGPLDPSVRTYFKPDTSTFSVPWPKFLSMVDNMDKSFLATENWERIKRRFVKQKKRN